MREADNNLKNLTKCPLCGTKYNHSQTVVLQENSNGTVFHLTCSKCGSAVLAFITENKQGVISLGLSTDLDAREANFFLKNMPVDKDEVLEIYKYLNNK